MPGADRAPVTSSTTATAVSVRGQRKDIFEFQGVAGSVGGLVVIEINMDGAQIPPATDARRPDTQGVRPITARIGYSARPMQAQVGKVRGQLQGRLETGEIENAEGGIVGTQKRVDLRMVPTRVAHLEGITVPRRQIV